MNIAIIDDEKLWRNMAHKLVQNHYAGVDINIEEFESGDSFLNEKVISTLCWWILKCREKMDLKQSKNTKALNRNLLQ